jgi:hypothetical protein
VTVEDVDDMWEHWEDHVLDAVDLTPVGDNPGECMDGYRAWFIRVLHPYMTFAVYEEHVVQRQHEHVEHVDFEPDEHGQSNVAEETYIEILDEVNDIAHELLMLNLGDVVDERFQRIRTLATTRPGDRYSRRQRKTMDGGEGPSS